MAETINNGESGLSVRGKLNDFATEYNAHEANVSNPHSVTKSQVGLGNADNTSDANKPVSTAQQTALDLKSDVAATQRTGTALAFDKDAVYNTIASPGSTNITLNVTGAKLGVTVMVFHFSDPAPSFPAEFNLISGTYDTTAGVVNRILCTYYDDNNVDYSISQPQ